MRSLRHLLALVVFAFAASGSALAAPSLEQASNATSASTSAGNTVTPCSSGLATGIGTIASDCHSAARGSTATAMASAGLGVIHASAQFNATSSTETSGASSQAQATLTDHLWFSGTPNSSARLQGMVVVSGGLLSQVAGSPLASNAAGSSYQLQGSFFGQSFNQSGSWTVGTNGYLEKSHAQAENIPIDISITFDSTGYALGSFSMYLVVGANGSANGYQENSNSALISGSASGEAGFGHTIYWGGISSLSINGVDVQDFSVQSASGLDYRVAAVPEPELWLMLSAGLGLVGWRARRRIAHPTGTSPACICPALVGTSTMVRDFPHPQGE
jgi:hypothetical protein